MEDRPFTTFDAPFEVSCTITRRGHKKPIPNGTLVVCNKPWAHVALILDLKENVFVGRRERGIVEEQELYMNEAGVGSIIDHAWHTCPLELCRANFTPPNYDYKAHQTVPAKLTNVYEDMYYYVAFLKGMYWARWDWIDVLRDASQVPT